MSPLEMQRELAKLQSKIDHYETEYTYLDRILLECGFSKGIKTLKATVEKMIYEGRSGEFEL
jgi:hypothetical protein